MGSRRYAAQSQPPAAQPEASGAAGALVRPVQTSFEREIDLETFATEGRAIARAVKAEVPDWSIVYFDEAAAARRNYRGPPANYETEIL